MPNIEQVRLNHWINTPQSEFEQEFASLIMETKRIPDPYHFGIDEQGNLLSSAGRRVSDIIYRGGYIGAVEGQAFDTVEGWVKGNKGKDEVDEEVMWVSPPYPGVYPDLKIIISSLEKKGSEKLLFNKAIIFDFDQEQSLRFTQSLAEFSQNYPQQASLEDIRRTPLMLNSEESSWVSVVQKLVNDREVWEYIETGKYFEVKQEALGQARLVYSDLANTKTIEDAQKRAILMLGPRSSSCPVRLRGTAFQVFSSSSALLGDFRSKDPNYCVHCGACGAEINQVVKQGQKCPAGCGATREC